MTNQLSGFISLIILCLICTLLVSSCVDPNSNDIIAKIKTVELGMNKKDVIRILGEPRKILEYELDGILYIDMLYEAPNRLDSTAPSVILCKETGVVVEVIVDDSGKHDKKSMSPDPCGGHKTSQ
jgi:hypothetical protein